jgi:hypothetical protein
MVALALVIETLLRALELAHGTSEFSRLNFFLWRRLIIK